MHLYKIPPPLKHEMKENRSKGVQKRGKYFNLKKCLQMLMKSDIMEIGWKWKQTGLREGRVGQVECEKQRLHNYQKKKKNLKRVPEREKERAQGGGGENWKRSSPRNYVQTVIKSIKTGTQVCSHCKMPQAIMLGSWITRNWDHGSFLPSCMDLEADFQLSWISQDAF